MVVRKRPEVADSQLTTAIRDQQLEDIFAGYEAAAMVAVNSMKGAYLYAKQNSYDIVELKRRPNQGISAFAVTKTASSGIAECWVHIEEDAYAEIFYKFLERYFDFPSEVRFPKSVQIDHIFSKHMCRSEGMNYCRLAPITQKGNSHSGSREYQFVKNRSAVPPYDPENSFNLTEKEWYEYHAQNLHDNELGYRVLWSPALVKLLPVFCRPPTKNMPALDVVRVLRILEQQGVLPESDRKTQFGLMLAAYRMYATGIPHYDAGTRARAKARDGAGNILSSDDLVGTWVDAIDLVDRSSHTHMG